MHLFDQLEYMQSLGGFIWAASATSGLQGDLLSGQAHVLQCVKHAW